MSLPSLISYYTEQQLRRVAESAVNASFLIAWERCIEQGHTPEEPDIVAALCVEGTKMLQAGWDAILRPYGIGITMLGVYCHQSPKVNYNNMRGKSCELGDLLICHFHRDESTQRKANALLLQAKKSPHQPHTISQDELDQLCLYTAWPRFKYTSGPFASQEREVTPPNRHRGAQYLQLDPRVPHDPTAGLMRLEGSYPAGVCLPDNTLVIHSKLEDELVNFLFSLSGRSITPLQPKSTEIGWSHVVWDLIELSLGKAFRRGRSGYIQQPRVCGKRDFDGVHCLVGAKQYKDIELFIQQIFGDYPPKVPWDGPSPDEGDDGWSPSLVVIETSMQV